MAVQRNKQAGFTLVFTIFLIAILTVLGLAVITKVFIGIKQSSLSKERQNASDAATIGLNMAMDEISPGLERMRNVAWTSVVSSSPTRLPDGQSTQAMVSGVTGAPTIQPVRELSVIGNIRNWDPFADWTQAVGPSSVSGWNKGWEYVRPGEGTQYFDAAKTSPVLVGTTTTNDTYWYSQLQPSPPTFTSGIMTAPSTWINAGVSYNEYPNGILNQPILRKVYTVRSNPLTRVAVFIRMSLQDTWLNNNNQKADFANKLNSNNSLLSPTGYFNFFDTNAISFSIFAVSEPRRDSSTGVVLSAPIRIHQALNVAVGGVEYVSNGFDNSNACVVTNAATGQQPTLFNTQPFFPPSCDSPRGDNLLVAGAPITGQVYPASGDLSYNFIQSKQATDQVVFLYEQIDTPPGGTHPNANGKVIFLIEKVAAGGYRRRLIFDWPDGFLRPDTFFGATGSNAASTSCKMGWVDASYSITSDIAFNGNALTGGDFTGNRYYANLKATDSTFSTWNTFGWNNLGAGIIQDHFWGGAPIGVAAFATTPAYLGTTPHYPYTELLSSTGSFRVATTDAAVNVVTWTNNPLCDWDSTLQTFSSTTRLRAGLPWYGPSPSFPGSGATVSYYITTFPYLTCSPIWLNQGGRLGLSYAAATQTLH